MKKKQIKNLAIALSLTAALGTGATLALLTAQTKEVTNTFTVGKNLRDKDILLNEAALQEDGRTANVNGKGEDLAPRVQALTFEDLMDRDVLDKEPTVQIKQDAAKCYMFVKIEGLDALAEKKITVDWNAAWVKADDQTDKLDGYYYYNGTGTTAQVLDPETLTANTKGFNTEDGKLHMDLDPLFTEVTVHDGADLYGDDGTPVELDKIIAKACAVQAQNVPTWQDAFKELPKGFGPEATTTTTSEGTEIQ